jgi:hypothetical protein
MNTEPALKRLLAILTCTLLTVSLGSAQELWDTTRRKMLSDRGYRMKYDYKGDEGKYSFRYTVEGDGQRILTEVLDGSARGAGTRIYFEPAKDPANVFMATKFLTLRRSLEARDIKDSSLYQPLFRQLIQEFSAETPVKIMKSVQGAILYFGQADKSQDRLQVDAEGNPLSYRRIEAGKEIKNMVFRDLEWGTYPIEWEK